MVSTRRDFLNSLSAVIGSSFLLTDNILAKTIGREKINDPDRLAKQYLLKKDSSYLNHASIGTVPKIIHEAHIKYLEICESNPSLYVWGKIWKDVHEKTRQLASSLIHCSLLLTLVLSPVKAPKSVVLLTELIVYDVFGNSILNNLTVYTFVKLLPKSIL